MSNIRNFRFCMRRDKLQNWEMINPILMDGEFAVVYSNGYNKLKIGDGISHFNELEYVTDPEIINILIAKYDILKVKINLLIIAFMIYVVIDSFLSIIGG